MRTYNFLNSYELASYDNAELPVEPAEGGDPKEPVAKPEPTPAPTGKTYTEKELDQVVLKERKKAQEQVRNAVAELEAVKKAKGTTEEQSAALQAKIEDLNNSLLTKDELKKKELEKAQKAHQEAMAALGKEKDTWHKKFVDSSIERTIKDAAAEFEAFSTEQINALLFPKAKLVPDLGEDGKENGQYTPKVSMPQEKDGKIVHLEMTINEAVKHMKDTPEKYGNLFKSNFKGGLGLGENAPSKPLADLATTSTEEYFARRKKHGAGAGFDRK